MRLNFRLMSAIFLLLTCASLASAEKKNVSVTFTEPVKIAGTSLEPGKYRIEWEGTGPEVQVSFQKNHKTIATAPARIVDQASHYHGATIETKLEGDSRVLQEIQLKKMALMFDEGSSGSGE